MSLKLAILASGSGSNAQAIIDAVARGSLDADIRLIACNRPGAQVLDRAAAAHVPSLCIEQCQYPEREAFDLALVQAIRESGADTIALAGYMRLLTPGFLAAFPNRVLNVHPALLPSFKGIHGVDEAREWGVKLTGCTVHFVSNEMDCGPIIIQACLPLRDGESSGELQERIHVLEHRIYPQALQWLAEDRLHLQGRQVRLAARDKALAQPPESALIWPPLERGF